MRIEAVELRRVALPMVAPFRAAHGTEAVKDVALVRLLTDGPEGWGECAALGAPTYTSEYTDAAFAVLRDHLVPRLLAGTAVDEVKGHPMAKAALEMAVLDASLRATGEALAAHLGAERTRVDAGVSVGMAASLPDLLDEVDAYVDAGYRRVKLKVSPGADVEVVAAVRDRHPALALQVDANGSYAGLGPTAAEALSALDEFGLLLIEQPLADDDLAGHAALAAAVRTPICLDESITSLATARLALDMGACTVVNIKPGRVGGYGVAKEIHDLCLGRAVPVWCGGMLETGLGRAANLALAALPGFTLPGDLSASDRYFPQDLTEPFVLEDGQLAVPSGAGIGVAPLPDVLASATVHTEVVRR